MPNNAKNNQQEISSALSRLRFLRTEIDGCMNALAFLDLEHHPERLTDPKCDAMDVIAHLAGASCSINEICKVLSGGAR